MLSVSASLCIGRRTVLALRRMLGGTPNSHTKYTGGQARAILFNHHRLRSLHVPR